MDQLPIMSGIAGAIEGDVLSREVAPIGAAEPTGKAIAFTFGDAEPVLDQRDMLGFCETWHNGRWYEPPVSMSGLTRAFDVPGPHASCIRLKVNQLVAHFVPSRWVTREDFRKLALDFIAVGNGYLERRDNLAGRPLAMKHSLARYTRRGIDAGRYFFVPGWRQDHEFREGTVFHMLQEHPSQEIYGIPEFYHALQAALMGEAATLFRRRYYLNGSHAGFIFYCSEETVTNDDADAIKEQLKGAKGLGNFKNLFIHAPGGKKDGVQIIPISEVAAKDEFMNIKLVSRDEMLSAHRTPPQLVGVVPANAAGFGSIQDAREVFHRLEIEPLQTRFEEVNDFLGVTAVSFRPYQGSVAAAA
ncbi:MAG TPA: phage portal protein [Allosphingosinicella sp.]|jgi:PBSX family phage portal protein